ncbi:acyltransferase family protein [Mesorhizobium sp. B2-3-12]|uniref:acyltransferase family protein n=1 Tax=Mesorhizobium sp. B2-3-12 TaxID=2589952 RepID=UPI001129D582|nr:acyltransferase family protein [Mesorhizobium sp. B2-3-12]TPL92222.1 acyltransferase [Mesorhizobium sp. B2-3-12]
MIDKREEHGWRPEIQGLRGVAVALVVVFHLWPAALPGGYVGVDVFFVISGFLITGLLARMATAGGHAWLLTFYSRRVRRLLPAALLALLVTLAGTLLFLSKARWEETAIQVAASALHVQNWWLALQAVDYLGAAEAPSPVQHYWSLSIEEQFYVVWPLLMAAAIWLARRFGYPPKAALIVALALVFTGSLAASVVVTQADPAWAYFVTHTRLWELALGGLLALAGERVSPAARLRLAMMAAGIGAIVASALLFSDATPFPGLHALPPTLGAVLVIAAGGIRLGRFRGLDVAILRAIGDRSYSIYLWHWPLIVFYTAHRPGVGLFAGLALMALTLGVSELSYRFVEQRYRRPLAGAEWRPLAYGSMAIAVCVAASGGLGYALDRQGVDISLIGTGRYPGPAALLANAAVPADVELLPPLGKLKRDMPIVYRLKCHQGQDSTVPVSCILGDPGGTRTVVVTGDSHAAQWIPAIDRIAREHGWKLVTFTKAACPFTRAPVTDNGKPYPACAQWRDNVLAEISKLRPELMFTSQSNYDNVPQDVMVEGLRSVWGELGEEGVRTIAIRNTPFIRFDPGDCLAANPDKCATPRKDGERINILALAAASLDHVRVVDMNDALCGKETCAAVVGNIIVWRDYHHMTATYALALAPYLAKAAGL